MLQRRNGGRSLRAPRQRSAISQNNVASSRQVGGESGALSKTDNGICGISVGHGLADASFVLCRRSASLRQSSCTERICENVFDLSLHQLIIRLGAALILIAIHGFALAGIARAMGDRGPQFDERLTLNPLNHFDVLGGLTMIFFQLGWIRPIAIDPSELRLGRIGLALCVVASIAATLVAVVLLRMLRIPALDYLSSAIAPTAIAILNEALEMCTLFAVFNLLPVPPLTGAHFLVAARPNLAPLLARYGLYCGIAWAALALLGVPQHVLLPVRDALARLLPIS
jgi:Zn-dependent protease